MSGDTTPLKPVEAGISVVIPTYNEVENIRPLCERLFKTFKENTITKTFSDNKKVELLLVDDESAGSEESVKIVDKLAKEGYPIRIHREFSVYNAYCVILRGCYLRA